MTEKQNTAAIEARGITYAYETGEGEKRTALDCVDLRIERGEWVCILGHNGSGKSTLAKHFNALLVPDEGEVLVCGTDTKDEGRLYDVRRQCGMVFQNPDNQLVATVVEEDVAFGPENLGWPREKIVEAVYGSLDALGMRAFAKRAPHMLSGGQKQRVAIAGVLAMAPDIIVFDEPTAMLDPKGRQEVLNAIRMLHSEHGKTIVLITHYMEEAADADRVIVMAAGRILDEGTPREIFSNAALIEKSGLCLPVSTEIYMRLKDRGVELDRCPIKNSELVDALCPLL